jgi:hypothetical protein
MQIQSFQSSPKAYQLVGLISLHKDSWTQRLAFTFNGVARRIHLLVNSDWILHFLLNLV